MLLNTKKTLTQLLCTIFGVFILLYGVLIFNRDLLMQFPLPARMVLMILLQWVPAIVPLIFLVTSKNRAGDVGFTGEKVLAQIGIGFVIAILMSVLFTVMPILLGLKGWVGSTNYSEPWQFIYEFIYCILGVAFAEEFIFRGFIFQRLLKLKNSKTFAVITSSVLFGIYHLFGGSMIQVLLTAVLGICWCMCREKMKYCSTLSLIIAHGTYDALITLWVAIL